jgi:hypothetical protein
MSVTLSLAAWCSWLLLCFALGWLAARWAHRPIRARRDRPMLPIDLRATLDGGQSIEELRAACRPSFEEARRER